MKSLTTVFPLVLGIIFLFSSAVLHAGEVPQFKKLRTIDPNVGNIKFVSLTPDGSKLAIASPTKFIIFETRTGRTVVEVKIQVALAGYIWTIVNARLSNDGKSLGVICRADREEQYEVRLYSIPSGKLVLKKTESYKHLPVWHWPMDLSSDGRYIAYGTPDRIRVVDSRDGVFVVNQATTGQVFRFDPKKPVLHTFWASVAEPTILLRTFTLSTKTKSITKLHHGLFKRYKGPLQEISRSLIVSDVVLNQRGTAFIVLARTVIFTPQGWCGTPTGGSEGFLTRLTLAIPDPTPSWSPIGGVRYFANTKTPFELGGSNLVLGNDWGTGDILIQALSKQELKIQRRLSSELHPGKAHLRASVDGRLLVVGDYQNLEIFTAVE